MGKTIEQQAADAILEREVASVRISGKAYAVAPPTIATLILVSEAVSQLPMMKKALDEETPKEQQSRIFAQSLGNAKHCRALGDIAAILLLGAKAAERKPGVVGRLLGRKSKRERLAKQVLESMSPSELFSLLIKGIKTLDLASFFALITSLSEANALKPTREVEQ